MDSTSLRRSPATPRRIAILLGVGFPPPWCAPTSWLARASPGVLPPKLGGGRSRWYSPEPSGTFHDLPEVFGTSRDGFGTFQNLLEHFQDLQGPLTDVPEPYG